MPEAVRWQKNSKKMSETRTFVFPEQGGGSDNTMALIASMLRQNNLDPNLLAMLNNNGGGFGGNSLIWLIFLIFVMGWNRNGFGGNGNGTPELASLINNDNGRDLLMSAIQGNGNAISQLATTLNCSIGQIQSALNALGTQVMQVGNQVGMSGQQVINAIQSGNCSIANQLAQCCCNIREAITKQGYENQLATANQTSILGGKLDQQTTLINDKFCQLEQRELQNKVDALREERNSLQNQISNYQQTATFNSMLQGYVAPLAQGLSTLQQDVAGLKCRLPETVAVAKNNGVLLSPCQAALMGYGLNGFPFNPTQSVWG